MGCYCWYMPKEKHLAELKKRALYLADYMKDLDKVGDPIRGNLHDVLELIEHLYTGECEERTEANG